MNKNKVLFITENRTFGGGNKYTEDLINSCSLCFSEVHFICNKNGLNFFNLKRLKQPLSSSQEIDIYNFAERVRHLPKIVRAILRLIFSPLIIAGNFISLLSLKRKIALLSPDLIILTNGGYPASLYLVFLTAFFLPKNTKCVMSIVGTPARKSKWFMRKFWRYVDSRLSEKLDYAIVNATNIKDALTESFQFSSAKIAIIRNGLEEIAVERARRQKSGLIKIGFLSRVERDKGIYELVSSFLQLEKDFANIRLIIVGTGSELQAIKEITKTSINIETHGYVEDATTFLSDFDIYVLPSYHEGLPYSLIEACRAGCAIVGTKVGGIPEVIKNGHSGIIIEPRDTTALKEALAKLIRSEEMRRTLSTNARKVFEEQLSLTAMNTKVMDLITALSKS